MPADRLFHPKLGQSVKVNALDAFEFRVWMTYVLTADDYGVMRLSAITVQASSEALERAEKADVQRALDKLVDLGLVTAFDHQGRRYCCQLDWQNYQRVKHPRDTAQPMPPPDVLAKCSSSTRKLFSSHTALKRSDDVPEDCRPLPNDRTTATQRPDNEQLTDTSKSSGEEVPKSESTLVNTRLTANGYRLMANGSEEKKESEIDLSRPGPDQWARELVNLYPAQGRCAWNLVERPLVSVLASAEVEGIPQPVAWVGLKERLEQHKRSHQWRVKGMIPRLDKWLRDGLHLQELPEDAPESPAKGVPAWAR